MAYGPLPPLGQTTASGSLPVVLASDQTALPLSTGAATSAKQDTGNTSLASIDSKLTNPLPVSASSLPLPSGAATAANQTTIIGHVDGIEGLLTTIDTDTGNIATSTASVDSKTPALGQALAAGSVPVVLTAAQISTLTPPAAITGYATAAAQTDKSQFTKITDGTDTALVTAAGEMNVLESNSAAIKTAVETIDNAVSGAGFNITQMNGEAIDVGAGTEAAALRVTLPTDGTGKIATVSTVTSLTQMNGQAISMGTGVRDAGTLRVTIATNDAVPVTFTGSTDVATQTTLAALNTKVVAGAGTEAAAIRVTLPTDGTGLVNVKQATAANLNATVVGTGTLAVQDSQVIADNAGFTDGTSKVFTAGYIYDEVAGTALTENDAAAGRINVNRAQVHTIEDGVTRGRYATVSAANALKVDASGVAVPVTDNSGSLTVDNAGTFAIQSTTATTSGNTTMQNAVSATGNGTNLTVTGYGTALCSITGSFTATVTFEGSTDAGTTWAAVSATQIGTSAIATTATVVGQYRLNVAGLDLLRARVTWTSGTSITVIGRATNAVNSNKIFSVSTNSIAKAEDAASADSDIGVPSMAVRKATPANTSGTDGDYEMLQMSAGRLWASATIDTALPAGTNAIGKLASNSGVTIGVVENETVASATLANVAASATSVTVLASAAGRKAAYFFNDSSSFCYLKFGATASTTSFTVKVDPFGFYEIPQPVYTGIIDGIWDSATGSIRVTSM